MDDSTTTTRFPVHRLLSKVPEVTIWFWIIKILCTTVGESFADWIDMVLGVGLLATAAIFIIVTAVVLTVQMRLRRYVPAAYWLTVVVMSVTGTLLTDILTDQLGVPLWASSLVFSVLLAIVFGVWYSKERTLSIHSIDTTPREAFYWLTVLVTFALGTALGDWTLELTGWGPGVSILLPLALIAIVTGLWRYGANPVLAFWIAYILTRPLGANIGDWLGLSPDEQGLGLGTFVTSVVFLLAILATVVYLSLSKADIDRGTATHHAPPVGRERRSLIALAIVAVAVVGLLAFTNSRPHAVIAAEGTGPACDASGTPSAAEVQASARPTSPPPTSSASGPSPPTPSPSSPAATRPARRPERPISRRRGTTRNRPSAPRTASPGPPSTSRSTPCSPPSAPAAPTRPLRRRRSRNCSPP